MLMRRKRLADGTLGPLEKITTGVTPEEKLLKLEKENNNLKKDLSLIQKYILDKQYEDLLENIGGDINDL